METRYHAHTFSPTSTPASNAVAGLHCPTEVCFILKLKFGLFCAWPAQLFLVKLPYPHLRVFCYDHQACGCAHKHHFSNSKQRLVQWGEIAVVCIAMLTATCKQHFCKVCRDVGNHRFADLPRNAFLKVSKAIFVKGIKCFTLQGVSTYQQRFADNNHYFIRILLHLSTGPALADAGPNARPGRGAQCRTYARGPSEQWFYGVIVFGQHNLFYVLFQILHKAGNGSFTLGQWLKVKLCKTKLNILKKRH